MAEFTDDHMHQMLATMKDYCIVLLLPGPKYRQKGAERIIWEHGRRNFSLRANGLMPIVCPVSDESSLSGLCIFNATPEKIKEIMDGDPAVKAGVFRYEIHACRSFPGDCLPE